MGLAFLAFIAVFGVSVNRAQAVGATRTWDGDTDSDWTNTANWAGDVVPSGTDNVAIPGSLSFYPIITNTTTSYSGTTAIQNGGSLTISSDGNFSTTGNITISSGGTLTVNGGVASLKGTTNSGTLAISGGTITATENMTLSAGTATFSGGTYNATTKNITINGGTNTQTGGTINVKDFKVGTSGTFTQDESASTSLIQVGHDFTCKPAGTFTSTEGTVEKLGTTAGGGEDRYDGTCAFDILKIDNSTGKVRASSTTPTAHYLIFGSDYKIGGTWGSTASSASSTDDTYFNVSGTGYLTVDPGGEPVTGYTVSYDNNSGSGTITDPSSPYEAEATVTVLSSSGFSKENYTFHHWNTQADNEGTSYDPSDTFSISSNITLYAQWEIDTHTVTFNKNGGDVDASPTSRSVEYNATTTLPTPPTRIGYDFASWNTQVDTEGATFDESTAVTSDTTVYAVWTPHTGETVTYDGNGSTGGSAPVDSGSYTSGDTVTVLSNSEGFTRTGYTFDHWNTQSNNGGTSYDPADTFTSLTSVTLYAQWHITSPTVTFNSNEGDSEASPTTRITTYDSTVTLPTPPTKTGYHFTRWDTQADGAGTTFSGTTHVTADITVYAIWTRNSSGGGSSGGGGGGSRRASPTPVPVTSPSILPLPHANTAPTAPSSNFSGVFTRTLKVGSVGADVLALQQFLNSNGFVVSATGPGSIGHETTYFGEKTKLALMKFQDAHPNEILVPAGLASGTGMFGVFTMKYVNSVFGAGQ